MKKTFEEFKTEMTGCIDNSDTEMAHLDADELLTEIALSVSLKKVQREELVKLYKEVKKWYA